MARRRKPRLERVEVLEARLTVTKRVSKLGARGSRLDFAELRASLDEGRYQLRQR